MDQIWWGRVPNAIAFVQHITECLLAEKSVILQSEQSIPWHDSLVEHIKESVTQQDSSKRFEVILHVDDPGSFLLNEFCKAEKRAEYRPTKSFARFLAESDDIVLHSRYLWVYLDSANDLDTWSAFASEYIKERGKSKEMAVFILEWSGERIKNSRKGVRPVSLEDYINEYDRMVFSMLASSSVKENLIVKNYLAELSSNVAENDIELLASCIDKHVRFLRDPYTVVREIVDTEYRSDGSEYSYHGTIENIEHCIWKAQIKTIYPLIEEFRGTFVAKHSGAISKELPIESAYGEMYEDPKDVELGTLVYMAANGKIILTSADYHQLKKNKDARNQLSHLNVLSIDEIRALLE
jgi:hypothetical protein